MQVEMDALPPSALAPDTAWRFEHVLLWMLLAVLAAMPLPFGSTRPWAWSLTAILIGLTLLSYALGLVFTDVRLAVPLRRMRVPLLLISVPVLWALFQMVPLGGSDTAHPIWQTAGEILGRQVPGRISVDPYATGTALMRLVVYLGVFFLAVQLCRAADRAFLALTATVVIGAGYALYGLLAYMLMPDQLVWLPRMSQRSDLSQALAGGSSYATFTGLGLMAAIALMSKLVHRPTVASSAGRRAILATLARTIGARAWAPAAATAALATAILFTQSRAGLLATGIGVVVLLLCLMSATRLSWIGRSTLAALVLAGIALTVQLASEAMPDPQAAGGQRAALNALVWLAIADAPLLGHGYGAFETAFQGYGDGTVEGYVPNAQNGYLELAFELGLPAAGLLAAAVAAVAVRCLIGVYARRRDIVYPALGAAAAALAGAQALMDFSVQVPAVAAMLAFILGLGYSQAWTSSDA